MWITGDVTSRESQNFIINNSLFLKITWGFLVAQTVNHLPTMQENRVQSLRQDDPLEKGMAPHSRFLTGESPWTEEPGGLQSTGLQRVGHGWVTNTFTLLLKLHLLSKHCSAWTRLSKVKQPTVTIVHPSEVRMITVSWVQGNSQETSHLLRQWEQEEQDPWRSQG